MTGSSLRKPGATKQDGFCKVRGWYNTGAKLRSPSWFETVFYIEKNGAEDELTLQLFVILYQWGFTAVTQADHDAAERCIRCMWHLRRGNSDDGALRSVVERTAGYLFTNWVMPQDTRDFQSYIRRVAFGLYLSEPRKRGPTPEKVQSKNVRASFGKVRRNKSGRKFVSVVQLATQAGLHRQRINEAIRNGRLLARKWRGRSWIEESDAEEFLRSVAPKLAARALRKELKRIGKDKEAETLRKWIYRHRKAGASNEQILEKLRQIREGCTDETVKRSSNHKR